MPSKYQEVVFTPGVLDAQTKAYATNYGPPHKSNEDHLTPAERAFITSRDSFYIASTSETGWPYVQHRGGDPGFLRVIDSKTLAFADRGGNRQLISVGNLQTEDRVALFLMDYAGRRRLKILGRATIHHGETQTLEAIYKADLPTITERVVTIQVIGFDWNCPKFITPRFTAAEVAEKIEQSTKPLQERILDLEAVIKEMEKS